MNKVFKMFNKEKRMKKWERTRTKGKTRFILIYGILKWMIIFSLIYAMYHNSSIPYEISFREKCLVLIVFCIIGMYNGNELWKLSEKAYKDYYDS